jgi:hypothetical protein
MVLMISVVALPTDAILAALFHMGQGIDVEMVPSVSFTRGAFIIMPVVVTGTSMRSN